MHREKGICDIAGENKIAISILDLLDIVQSFQRSHAILIPMLYYTEIRWNIIRGVFWYVHIWVTLVEVLAARETERDGG